MINRQFLKVEGWRMGTHLFSRRRDRKSFANYPDPGMGLTESLTAMILTFQQRSYFSQRILLYNKYTSHELRSAHYHFQKIFIGMEAGDLNPVDHPNEFLKN